jgi:queuosine precursor transporter
MTTQTLTSRAGTKLAIAFAIYLTSLFAANTLGLKTMPFIWGTHLSVSIFFFPFVFLMTDVIGEIYGKSVARLFVLGGIVSTVLFILFSFLSFAMPWSVQSDWAQPHYGPIFGLSVRMAIASVVAFAVAEYQDVVSFFFFRKKIGGDTGKFFWLRSNLSNLWSQFLDTALFMLIAFAGAGVYTWAELAQAAFAWWMFKVAMGGVYTPLSYLGLWLMRDKK